MLPHILFYALHTNSPINLLHKLCSVYAGGAFFVHVNYFWVLVSWSPPFFLSLARSPVQIASPRINSKKKKHKHTQSNPIHWASSWQAEITLYVESSPYWCINCWWCFIPLCVWNHDRMKKNEKKNKIERLSAQFMGIAWIHLNRPHFTELTKEEKKKKHTKSRLLIS